ncbi:MAG TPA: carbohydrate kinase [Propionibacteriaceae bacterium]|nr:carbohydrate kinase [Propionibacteriaceae bacterium]
MRFVVCGEALIDLIPEVTPPLEDPAFAHLETRWRALSAGGPMNTAIALRRLGEDVQFMGRLGSDGYGEQIGGHLRGNGVGLDLARVTSEATSLALVSLDEHGHASYTFHFADTANFSWTREQFPVLTADDWLHFGSLVTVVAPGASALLGLVRDTEAAVSFDINVRPTVLTDPVEYWERVEPFLMAVGRQAGIVKASDEDIAFLVGGLDDPEFDPVAVAAAWTTAYGLSLFVVTLGAEGVAAVKPDGRVVRFAGYPVEVVDTVGAGDTFMAGFLSAWVANPADLEGALQTGAAAAAIVCGRRGANPPTTAEVEARIATG